MDLNVLAMRKRLSIFEAAGLLSGNRQQIVELMREAIEDGELSAIEVVRHGIYSADNGGWRPGGAIDYMQTTLEYAEFQRWFDATGLQTPLTAPAKTPVTTDERALMRAAARFVNPTLGDANRSLEELAHFEQARIEGERAKAKARAEGLAAGMAKELLSPEPRAERESVIAMPTKQGVIELPAGTKHVRFEELPHLIASALVPIDESSSDAQILHFSEAEVMLLDELNEAVSGELPVKNPLTFGPYMPNGGVRLNDCVVLVQDLRQYVAKRGLSVEVQEEDGKPRSKKITWRDVSLDYVLTVLAESKSTTAKALFNVLERKAGPDSPFDKGTGDNRGSLIVRKINEPLKLKTLQNAWPEIKAGTQKD